MKRPAAKTPAAKTPEASRAAAPQTPAAKKPKSVSPPEHNQIRTCCGYNRTNRDTCFAKDFRVNARGVHQRRGSQPARRHRRRTRSRARGSKPAQPAAASAAILQAARRVAGGVAAVHHDGTNAHVHSVGHTHKDHSGRLQPPVLPPFRKTLIVTISFVSPKRWADAGVCITFGALQVDT